MLVQSHGRIDRTDSEGAWRFGLLHRESGVELGEAAAAIWEPGIWCLLYGRILAAADWKGRAPCFFQQYEEHRRHCPLVPCRFSWDCFSPMTGWTKNRGCSAGHLSAPLGKGWLTCGRPMLVCWIRSGSQNSNKCSVLDICFFGGVCFLQKGLYDADVILKQLRSQIPLFSIPFNHQ